MALVGCPECSKEISDRARACPHCGNPMSATAPHLLQVATPDDQTVTIQQTSRALKRWYLVAWAIFAFGAGGFFALPRDAFWISSYLALSGFLLVLVVRVLMWWRHE